MRKLYEIFKVLEIQKRIVYADTIPGNMVLTFHTVGNGRDISAPKNEIHTFMYVSGQSGLFWAVLKLLKNSNMKS